jgi:apolipoprotein D and lipocalin family protein
MTALVLLVLSALGLTLTLPAGCARAADGSPETADDPAPMRTVAAVDLERYAGLWYEIARIPNRFQKNCARGTTAEYTLGGDGKITIVNQCYEDDGDLDRAEGVARVVDADTRAQLEVSFVSFLGWRPFWGDYWVIGLDDDYRWAVVGEPERDYGWILARTPTLSETDLAEAFAAIESNGYDLAAFEMSRP